MQPPEAHRNSNTRNWSALWRVALAVIMLGSLPTSRAEAQPTPHGWEVKAVVGLVGFLGNQIEHHYVIGGSVRKYVSPRVAVEPEFLYIRHNEYRKDFVLQGNVIRDVAGNDRFRPYLVGGIGIVHRRKKSPGAQRPFFAYNGLTAGGGAGVRIRAGDRLVVSPEFRVGFETLFRATVAIGGTVRR